MLYSIVIPCYNSSLTIGKIAELVNKELENLEINNYEMILVNDCSPDGGETLKEIDRLVSKYNWIKGIDLAKNVGQHNAVIAGLNYAKGDYIIAMDDDMQTHPSQLCKLIKEAQKGYDVVYAYYPQKKHGMFRNIGSWFNSMSVRVLIGKPKELKTSSFWIIKKFVRDYVIQYKNSYSYIQGLFLRTTRNISCIPVEHFKREEGSSNYTLKSLIKLWSNILGFSVVPLRIASVLGAFFAIISFISGIVIMMRKVIFDITVEGWTSIIVVLVFLSGLILLFLGLLGEYLGRMFLAMNREPQFVIREIYENSSNKEE